MSRQPPKVISNEAWAYGQWDVGYWAEVYLGIKLHPGQIRFANSYLKRTSSGWRALYLWLCVSAGNRAGKTLALAIIILHSCFYKMGMTTPTTLEEAVHRLEVPYEWWHFAIEQGPAEQTFNEMALIFGGTHPAQKMGNPWVKHIMAQTGDTRDEAVSKIVSLTDTGVGSWCKGAKERGEYAIVRIAKELGGAQIHFRSTKAKALSAIGQNMHGLSFDEAGLEPQLTYLLEEVMHARRLGTGGQFIIISTPSVATSTDFQDLWYKGDPEDPFQEPRRYSMRMSSRENIGYGLDEESFDALTEHQPEAWIRQNIEGEFIQASTAWFSKGMVDRAFEDLPKEQEPEEGALYLHALDPGLKDKCWSIVFKVVRQKMGKPRIVGVNIDRMVGKQTVDGIVRLGEGQHRKYERRRGRGRQSIATAEVITGVDTTALGGHMFSELLETAGVSHRKVEFGGQSKVKREMLSDLRTMFDEGLITMPTEGYWAEARKQLTNYKLLDRKIEQDIVMALAIIAKMMRSIPPIEEEERGFVYGVEPTISMENDKPVGRDHTIDSRSIRRAMRLRHEEAMAKLTE